MNAIIFGGAFEKLAAGMPIRATASPDAAIPVARQCELIGLPRSSYYAPEAKTTPQFSEEEGRAMAAIDRIHPEHPCYGARRIPKELRREDGIDMKRRKVASLMEAMGIKAIYPKPNTSAPSKQHPKSPRLLKGKMIRFPNQVWSTGISYIKIGKARMYLSIVIDWFSRCIVGWRLHDALEASECVTCMKEAFGEHGAPAYANSDRGATYSSNEYISPSADRGVTQSMDGKGRWVDDVICERAFRTIKQECAYINDYSTPNELRALIGAYIDDCNNKRLHPSLDYETPTERYYSGIGSMELPVAA